MAASVFFVRTTERSEPMQQKATSSSHTRTNNLPVYKHNPTQRNTQQAFAMVFSTSFTKAFNLTAPICLAPMAGASGGRLAGERQDRRYQISDIRCSFSFGRSLKWIIRPRCSTNHTARFGVPVKSSSQSSANRPDERM